jgi:hypothetical protein
MRCCGERDKFLLSPVAAHAGPLWRKNMACLFGLLALASPRLAFALVWLLSDRVSVAFSHVGVALFGLILLPWTALVYTLAYDPTRGVSDRGWAVVALAFFVDVYSYVRGASERQYASV